MKPLADLPRARVRAVFTDLDDTLTEGGRISPDTYAALGRLAEGGLPVVVVSGRPAGWADCLMRLWPLDAMIFENGAGLFVREGKKIRNVLLAPDTREAQRKKLDEVYRRLQARVPGLRLAQDQPYRLFDMAIDFAEDEPRLPDSSVRTVLELLAKEPGITAKLSSIHVNFWCGSHDKLTACDRLLATWGKERNIAQGDVVFCGDSPNDEPLFARFPLSVGVANIADFASRLTHRPQYVTSRRGGLGFRELADFLRNG